jgi:putative membrane protein
MPSDAPLERRLHPATLGFQVIAHARSLLVPALLVFFFASGDRWQLWLGLLFVPVVLFDVVHYLTLRWRFEADELVLRQGWIFRRVRHVPYARVQNVDLAQGPLHRLCRVAEVKIETAGGGAEEAVLKVISLAQYEELRERIFAGRRAGAIHPHAAPQTAAPELLLELKPRDLFFLALNPSRGLALVAVAWGIAWEFNVLDRIDLNDQLGGWVSSQSTGTMALEAAAIFAAALLAVFLLSLAATFLALWGFRLEQEQDLFRIRRGLLTRQVASIPRRRVQIVTVKQTWFHAMMGKARVLVGTAGGNTEDEGGKTDSGAQFAPLLPVSQLDGLLRRIRPDLDLQTAQWQPLAPKAARRMAASSLLFSLPAGAALIYFFDWIGATLAALLMGFGIWHAWRGARRAGWQTTPWGMVWRSGAFGRSTSAAFDDKLQAVSLRQNPFDRRHGHATLTVDTAGGQKTGHQLHLPYLPRATAELLRQRLVDAAAATRFKW